MHSVKRTGNGQFFRGHIDVCDSSLIYCGFVDAETKRLVLTLSASS